MFKKWVFNLQNHGLPLSTTEIESYWGNRIFSQNLIKNKPQNVKNKLTNLDCFKYQITILFHLNIITHVDKQDVFSRFFSLCFWNLKRDVPVKMYVIYVLAFLNRYFKIKICDKTKTFIRLTEVWNPLGWFLIGFQFLWLRK